MLLEYGIGFLGLTRNEFGRLTMRQLMWRLEYKAREKEDSWDHVRHIIAGYVGKAPERIMRLKRDRIEITDDLKKKAEEFLLRMRQSYGRN